MNEFTVPIRSRTHKKRTHTGPGLWQGWKHVTQLVFQGKTDFRLLWEKNLVQYTDYVYITVIYVYILNPSYKKGKKMTILDITKKEKYILKNIMVIWVLKSKTFYSLLFLLPAPHLLCVICRSILFQSLGHIV